MKSFMHKIYYIYLISRRKHKLYDSVTDDMGPFTYICNQGVVGPANADEARGKGDVQRLTLADEGPSMKGLGGSGER